MNNKKRKLDEKKDEEKTGERKEKIVKFNSKIYDIESVVVINISGEKFTISKKLILAKPKTRLAKILSDEKVDGQKVDDQSSQAKEEKDEKLQEENMLSQTEKKNEETKRTQTEKKNEENRRPQAIYFDRSLERRRLFPLILEYYQERKSRKASEIRRSHLQKITNDLPHGCLHGCDENEKSLLLKTALDRYYEELLFWKIFDSSSFSWFAQLEKKSQKFARRCKKNVDHFLELFLASNIFYEYENKHFDLYFQHYPESILKCRLIDDDSYHSDDEYSREKFDPLPPLPSNLQTSRTEIIKTTSQESELIKNFLKWNCSSNSSSPIIIDKNIRPSYNKNCLLRITNGCKKVGDLHPILIQLYFSFHQFMSEKIFGELRDELRLPGCLFDIIIQYDEQKFECFGNTLIDAYVLHYVLFLFSSLISGTQLFDSCHVKNDYDKSLEDVKSQELKAMEARSYAIDYLFSKGIRAEWIKRETSCRIINDKKEEDQDQDEELEMNRLACNGRRFPFDNLVGGLYGCDECSYQMCDDVMMNVEHWNYKRFSVWILRLLW